MAAPLQLVGIPQARPLLALNGALTAFGVHADNLSITNNYLTIEHNVNGMWNAILNNCYPTGDLDFVINPEAYPGIAQTQGLRADLIVREVNAAFGVPGYNFGNGRPILCYEGKGGAAGDTWDTIKAQLLAYLHQAVGNAQGSAGWAIGAKGDEVKFWRYTAKFVGNMRMVPVTFNPNQVVYRDQLAGVDTLPYSIRSAGANGHWQYIQAILEHMSSNYAPY